MFVIYETGTFHFHASYVVSTIVTVANYYGNLFTPSTWVCFQWILKHGHAWSFLVETMTFQWHSLILLVQCGLNAMWCNILCVLQTVDKLLIFQEFFVMVHWIRTVHCLAAQLFEISCSFHTAMQSDWYKLHIENADKGKTSFMYSLA